jgi:hypothetical protein
MATKLVVLEIFIQNVYSSTSTKIYLPDVDIKKVNVQA